MPHPVSRRYAGSLGGLLAALAFALTSLASPLASAQDKVTFLTSWFAQAEHGGFYQAVATGLYKKHGLDVSIKMGGPQVNGLQLLTAGQTEFLMSYDFSVLKAIEQGLPKLRIEEAAAKKQAGIDSGKEKIVGVNVFQVADNESIHQNHSAVSEVSGKARELDRKSH